MDRPELFWDSSGLIAAIMSRDEQSAGRKLLRLGEAGAVKLVVSDEVLSDLEFVIRKRRPDLVPLLTELLKQANIETVPEAGPAEVDKFAELTGYRPDARVLAAADGCGANMLVTNDRKHLLGNPLISPPDTSVRVVSPSDALDRCRTWLVQMAASEAPNEPTERPDADGE